MTIDSPLESLIRIDKAHKLALDKLGIFSIKDLLYHFPLRYGDTATLSSIQSSKDGEEITIYGRIKKLKLDKTFRTKIARATATIEDESGSIKATWFNQPYIAKMYQEGEFVKVSGKIKVIKDQPILNNPSIEKVETMPIGVGDDLFGNATNNIEELSPIYKLSKGISSLWIHHAISKIFKSDIFENIQDPIPEKILKKYSLPKLSSALIYIHHPQKQKDALAARKRFAFEEVFLIQLQKLNTRKDLEGRKTYDIDISKNILSTFLKTLPFKLTDGQQDVIDTVLKDLGQNKSMSRLLEGDVGSGKTAIAAAIAYCVTQTSPTGKDFGNLQVAYMAPTEVLAKQLFESFIEFFKPFKLQIGLITGSGAYKFPSKVSKEKYTNISKPQLLKWVANGEIPILIGTHALIQKKVSFKHLALVIIDEQHRFGTNQRAQLANKDTFLPHLLSMTATPIPRTLALTIYGDLDLSVLDQMPHGRKPAITQIISDAKRKEMYEHIRKELDAGRQAYVICPRIFEPDEQKQNTLIAKSVIEEAKRLSQKEFNGYAIGVMHSKLSKIEKEKEMQKFAQGETQILVSTSVVEVGVNVPNATVIVIEGAERFGLAQLHQLRGRVLRSSHQAYCYLYSESKSEQTLNRLTALTTAKSGFDLAEIDLQNRGMGELAGGRQWGVSDLAMEAIKNLKMVEAARTEAREIVEGNSLANFPLLEDIIKKRKDVHFE
ncbi:MAG: ATP-dependent helicase, ATP-dependent helicase RecG [Candidatus Parcubacteria bacterium]|jgi:ATP-dependent DNA helicase RecG